MTKSITNETFANVYDLARYVVANNEINDEMSVSTMMSKINGVLNTDMSRTNDRNLKLLCLGTVADSIQSYQVTSVNNVGVIGMIAVVLVITDESVSHSIAQALTVEAYSK